MTARILFIVGTIHWFLLTIGHPILVDVNLVLGLPGPLGPEVVLQRHASQSTPWVYFNKTGEGETGRGHNL